jgi:hypothetical protein
MILGSAKLLEWFESNNCIYWTIFSGEGKGKIFNSDVSENISKGDSLTRLQQVLNLLGNGTYFIQAWHTGLNANSYFKTRFIIDSNSHASVNGIGGVSPVPQIDIRAEIERGINDYKNSVEIERLRAENAELQAEVNDKMMRILGRIEPYLGDIISGFFPQAKPSVGSQRQLPVNNNNNTQEMHATPEEQSRLENAIENWSASDPDFIKLTEKIAQLAKSDPSTYNMAKNMLLNK